ncbi:lysosomal acid glucosylceramidase-like [Aphidius gifuensis]|uniref:lysosomal acid glucosylceramidase-like n=1 Tax=Aphidius gifuensis TaxID=684658 RepID=UPI001CDD3496|nr:lysosomal acid glucosylceramidase-like [Aphidius gifuensis]XP_044017111.1 lysosomal acid glucosylceramidase-like [Aphidius gifuensis]
MMDVLLLISIFCIIEFSKADDCIPRKFPNGIVCVCNSTYCDSIEIDVPPKEKFRSYISSKDGKRFEVEDGDFSTEITNDRIVFSLSSTRTYQTINGFGGAFTDSTGININKLSNATREQLLQTYFSKKGSSYSLCRVPIGGTDFSTRPYTLDDSPDDYKLEKFSLTNEDHEYKIPYMKKGLEINPQLKFVSASWSAPAWMKTNNNIRGFLGKLQSQYYQIYANYLIKFLEAYKNQNLPMWAISTGNEPLNAAIPFISINDMLWTPASVTDWVVNNFGPTLEHSNSNETIILALDDQRFLLPWVIDQMYRTNKNIDKYISGIAVHWYGDMISSVNVFDETHEKYPNKFLLMTEACSGSFPQRKGVLLGSWERGENYIKSIIEDMNHWITGWIDWNLVLDRNGGPTWVNNNVDSPIIVNPETDEFFKQPMYYALAHVSKFVPPGSVRIKIDGLSLWVQATAFKTPDNNIVILLHNPTNQKKKLNIIDKDENKIIDIEMDQRSIRTIIYKK